MGSREDGREMTVGQETVLADGEIFALSTLALWHPINGACLSPGTVITRNGSRYLARFQANTVLWAMLVIYIALFVQR